MQLLIHKFSIENIKKSKELSLVYYGIISMTILSIILMLIHPHKYDPVDPKKGKRRRAFIIGIDGIGNLPKMVKTPGINRITRSGVFTFEGQTVYPSLSAESWASLLHGVGPEKHRIYTNFTIKNGLPKFTHPKSSYPLTSDYPSIFRLVNEKRLSSKMACFSNWDFIPKYIIEDGLGVYKFFNESENEIVNEFEKYMKENDPLLVFIQLDSTDKVGHKYGFYSEEQEKQLIETDKNVGRIIDIIEKYGRRNENLILIQSDHGGGGNYFDENKIKKPSSICEKCMHGSKDPLDMTIFWAARGNGICQSEQIQQQVSIKDTAKFVASFLKLKHPETWDGYDLYPELTC